MVPFFRLCPIVVLACWNEPEQVYCHILGISSLWGKFPCRKIIPKRHFRRHSCDATSKGRGDSWRSRFLDYSTAKKQLHHPTQGVILQMFSVFFKQKFPEVLFLWNWFPWQISSVCQNCLKIWSMKKSWKTTALVSPNPHFSFSNDPGTLHNHLC